ncbi:Eukaryotic translation initiation factor 3 subunit C [Trichinella patagoniensis]|uniref:Eukaryotic translation initiation factor 3 subunit C n=1 Tax=Trichinella patagoniensis TaxID=990121 RepID=A0A0V0ZBN9_9BILA|nr:Eukaryotic translation initiation factor 3 subunit C [Trichinella patagoniensis]
MILNCHMKFPENEHDTKAPDLAVLEGTLVPIFLILHWRRQMSENNARDLTTLRQKLRKYMREFDLELADYKEAPDMAMKRLENCSRS